MDGYTDMSAKVNVEPAVRCCSVTASVFPKAESGEGSLVNHAHDHGSSVELPATVRTVQRGNLLARVGWHPVTAGRG